MGGCAGPAAEAETAGLAGPAAEADMAPAEVAAMLAVAAAPTAEETTGEAEASPGMLAGAAWAPMTATRPKRAAIIVGLEERLHWDREKDHQRVTVLHRWLIYEVMVHGGQEELLGDENGGERKDTTVELTLGLHSELKIVSSGSAHSTVAAKRHAREPQGQLGQGTRRADGLKHVLECRRSVSVRCMSATPQQQCSVESSLLGVTALGSRSIWNR